jgi:hypothetical protein
VPAGVPSQADWVLLGAALHTGEPSQPLAQAFAVRGERIVFVGDTAAARSWIGGATRVVDGTGLHAYPGLIDAHAHLLSLGSALSHVDLVGAQSLEEALARVEAHARSLPPGAWVVGRGWDQNDWPGARFPTARDLDARTGGRPACLERVDGHAVWVTSEALRRAGIDAATPDPEGGQIVRGAGGEATGILVDTATGLVERLISEPSPEEIRERYLLAQRACLGVGLTGVHDMGVREPELRVLRAMDAAGELRLRLYAALADDTTLWEREWERGPEGARPGRRLAVRAVKLYADGALGSRGAALFEEYEDDPGNRGLLVTPPDTLAARALRAARAGYQVCVHAIGDRGNAVALDALAGALAWARAAEPGHPPRPRIEHAQVLRVEDMARFVSLGVIASMQPTHCTSDMPWAPARLGPERVRGAYAWRDLAARGVPLALGSDFPVESHDPRLGLYAAVTRRTPGGEPPAGWAPEQRLTLVEALEGMTRGAAYAAFQESELGRIAVGNLADLTIFGEALSDAPPERLLTARLAATVIGGRVEHAAEPGRWGLAR